MESQSTTIQPQVLLVQLAALVNRYHLIAVYAFGSRADEAAARLAGRPVKPEYPASDLDIGILPHRKNHLSVDDCVDLAIKLEDLFGVARVDLVVLPKAPPLLALEIVRGELLYTSDTDAEAEYQLFVLARAGDLADWELERRQMLLTGEAI